MKRVLITLCLPICLGIIVFASSCSKENIDETETEVVGSENDDDDDGNGDGTVVSCEGDITGLAPWYPFEYGSELEAYLETLSTGDQCWNIYNVQTTIDENCDCPAGDAPEGYCESVSNLYDWSDDSYAGTVWYNGDSCSTSTGQNGTVVDCECVAEGDNGGDDDDNQEGCESVSNLVDWWNQEFPNNVDGAGLDTGNYCVTSSGQPGSVVDCQCVADDNDGGDDGDDGDQGECQGDVTGIDVELALQEFGTQESLDEWIMTLSPGDWCVTANNWQATVSEDCNCE